MNAYLKKSIAAIVMTMAMGHAIDGLAANNSSTGDDPIDTINVHFWDNPFDVATGIFDWTIEDYEAWDYNMNGECGEGGCGEGGNGEYVPPPEPTPCAQLLREKPENCPNPLPFPNGYTYGSGEYAGGSGIPRLLYWIDHTSNVDPAAREFARTALSLHTIDIAQGFVTQELADQRLILSVQTACQMQNLTDQQNPWIVQEVSPMERDCIEILERLQAEAGQAEFRTYFHWWLEREGLHLDDLGIPESIVDLLSPSNSLRVRYTLINADAKCSRWWANAQTNQCTF